MEFSSRDHLRREVRRVVHRACWRRLDGDVAAANALLDRELGDLMADAESSLVEDAELQLWVAEDEAEFERAVLVSDLVARRIGRITMPASPQVEVATGPGSPGARSAHAPPAGGTREIADFLDEMLAQQNPRRTAE